MNNILVVLSILVTMLYQAEAQAQYKKKAAPAYLMTQKFPDSVLHLNMLSLKGESVTFKEVLAQAKGKKIVLDFWASWCPDCIKGLPKLKAVQEKTDDDTVGYVFISVDEDGKRWERAIEKHGMEGTHYRIPSGFKNSLTNYIDLDWIPRYMILDEQGAMVFPKAVSASNKAFKQLLIDKK